MLQRRHQRRTKKMALEFPAQAPTLQQKLTTQQGAASVQAGQGLTAGGFGGQRELAAQKGIEAVTKAAGQASAQVQANQTQNLAQSTQQLTNQGQQALQVDAAQQSDALARQRIALSQQSRQLSQVLATSEAASASELLDSNLKFRRTNWAGLSSMNVNLQTMQSTMPGPRKNWQTMSRRSRRYLNVSRQSCSRL